MAVVSSNDDVRTAVDRLRGSGALRGWGDGPVAFRISLAAWAEEIAATLHNRFGDRVDLTVGYLHYPDRTWPHPLPGTATDPVALVEPGSIDVSIAGPAEIRSGYDLVSELVVANRGADELVVNTNGQVTAHVVDPRSGRVVGGFAGLQKMPLVRVPIGPGTSQPIRLIIGTASRDPALGYAVPPGPWAIRVTLALGARGWFRTPSLPITVAP